MVHPPVERRAERFVMGLIPPSRSGRPGAESNCQRDDRACHTPRNSAREWPVPAPGASPPAPPCTPGTRCPLDCSRAEGCCIARNAWYFSPYSFKRKFLMNILYDLDTHKAMRSRICRVRHPIWSIPAPHGSNRKFLYG
jgi:hypothetical protein